MVRIVLSQFRTMKPTDVPVHVDPILHIWPAASFVVCRKDSGTSSDDLALRAKS